MIRTAPPEYREVLKREITNGNWSARSWAVFNLLAYPTGDTKEIIRKCLDDPVKQEVVRYSGTGTDIVYYPIRQAAYLALRHLGSPVVTPHPYYSEVKPPGFDIYGHYRLLKPRATGSTSYKVARTVRENRE